MAFRRVGQHAPAMIVWLATVALHGAGAGITTGIALLVVGTIPTDLLLMQLNWVLSTALYLYICTQIGISSAVALAVSFGCHPD